MIKIENVTITGWEPAIRGMRNPMDSWNRSDSGWGCDDTTCANCAANISNDCGKRADTYIVGQNDYGLMMRLARAGAVHAKYRRMIVVYADITAPLYWWKEADVYRVGTVTNSCSSMHHIHKREFTMEDFSCEHLLTDDDVAWGDVCPMLVMDGIIYALNTYRKKFLESGDKKYWWQMIQLLPSSYNQKRTFMMNYEVLSNMYHYRKNHKLDEWRDFCKWIETLPYAEIITCKNTDEVE